MNEFRPIESVSLEVDGAIVTCHVGGNIQDGRDPVVLLHGIGGSTALDFGFIFPMLARHRRVMAVDFGLPALGEGETLHLERLAEQVLVGIDRLLPGRRVTLVGYSLGAVVAAAVAARHPAPRRLILVSGWLKAAASHRMFVALWQRLGGQGPEGLSQLARFSALSNSFINSCPSEELHAMCPISPGLFTNALLHLMTTVDLTAIAPRICIPTLVIGCSDDAISGRDQSAAIVGAIADARYVEVESGHAVTLERPAELLSLIDRFLHSQEYASASAHPKAGA